MKDFEERLLKFHADRDWNELRPADIAKSLIIEAAELLEIFQWDNQTLAEVRADEEKMTRIKKELADVIIYAYSLAHELDLNMEEIAIAKLAKAEEKYPVELFNKETRRGEAGTEALYREVKERYRKEGKN